MNPILISLLVVATIIALALLLMPILFACSQAIINQWATKQQLLNDRIMEQYLHVYKTKLEKEKELALAFLQDWFTCETILRGGSPHGNVGQSSNAAVEKSVE